MSLSVSTSARPLPLALSLGVLGGAALIASEMMVPGARILLVYGAFVVASLVAVRLVRWPDLSPRFWATFLGFMVATLVLYAYLLGFAPGVNAGSIPLSGHAWRLGMMAGIGVPVSAAVAYLAGLGHPEAA